MSLIRTQTAPISKWWITEGLKLIEAHPDLFSKDKMRQMRTMLIVGSNRLDTIKGWLLASQIIQNDKRRYYLSDFGYELKNNDSNFEKSSTWWAFHLSLCFSSRGEPYSTLFKILNPSNEWYASKKILKRMQERIEQSDNYIEDDFQGVKSMFQDNKPLADLELIEFRPKDLEIYIRLGSPTISDEILLYALTLARFHVAKNRTSITFTELLTCGLNHFICLSPDELRKRLRNLHRSARWQSQLRFDEVKGLDTVEFLSEDLNSHKMLLNLLQNHKDSWL
ncbi:DUF4007 family protein [Candidatus Venteria ishoeyi]|uniref:DUF4007 domain-containing protein n=1 Tax=Candidatus Venteria ishoeyi TaxID=1899563 RepID=A0A1H6FC24_9GAMM|nr:DUF4007 family protein [Candidatus Venteria ishoeyi]MDM8545778.1 DUF4007 family protein [Candidatus Venteria ishoeyi]SEH06869.1 Uncharacterised protein [Candidatus Venteria ishoeyi]